MKKKLYVLSISFVIVGFAILNVSINISPVDNTSSLSLKNVEALASPETGIIPDCVEGPGFCVINDIKINYITLKK